MELSAQAIRDIQFREKLRGYHPDDVDEFLSQVATAVDQLHRHVRELSERAAAAEQRVAELATTEESLQRTLILAQRTADLALREAREEAASMVARAQAERDAVVRGAEELRRQLTEQAQAEAGAELVRLHVQREHLRADVEALQTFVETERTRLREALSDQLRRLEEGQFRTSTPPELHAVDVLLPTPEPVVPTDGHAAGGAEPAEGDGWPGESLEGAARPDAGDNDEFLAELRRAVTDTTPLGPRDDDVIGASFGEHEHDIFEGVDDDGGRFTSRLRRRR